MTLSLNAGVSAADRRHTASLTRLCTQACATHPTVAMPPNNQLPPAPNCTKRRVEIASPTAASVRAAASGSRASGTITPIRLAIATLFIPNDACSGMRCGLLAWCSGARRLRAAMPDTWSVRLVALTTPQRAARGPPPKAEWCGGGSGAIGRLPTEGDALDLDDCPELRLITPSPALHRAVRDFMARRQAQLKHRRAVAWNNRMGTTLYKWELMAHGSMYDALLFSDLDVELLPPWLNPAAVAAEWSHHLVDLVGRTKREHARGEQQQHQPLVRMVASPDWSSPVNAGLMLLLPPPHRALFQRGLHVLGAPFNTSHGFNLSGTPLQLFGWRKLHRTDGTVLMHAGAPATIDNQNWDFVGADVDQGFLLYMLHQEYELAFYPTPRGAHWVRHFWGGGPKPWHRILRNARAWNPRRGICHIDHLRAYNYLKLLPLEAGVKATPCVRAYRSALAELEEAQIGCCPNLELHRHTMEQHYPGAEFKPF